MSDSDFGTRKDAIDNKLLEVGLEKDKLNYDLGVAMAERLLKLFSNRSKKDQQSWPTFEGWLGAQFEYDAYSYLDIFKNDDELKKLLDNAFDRPAVSKALNDFLRDSGHRCGVNRGITNIIRI